MNRSAKRWLWAVLGTLAIHVGLAVFLWLQATRPPGQHQRDDGLLRGEAAHARSHPDISAAQADAAVLLRKQMQFTARLTHQQREDELKHQVQKMAMSVRHSSIPAITQMIAAATVAGDSNQVFVPRPDATGPFDQQDFVIHDITSTPDKAGKLSYQILMVDRQGVMQTVTTSRLHPDLQTYYRVFEMARQVPAMRPLLTLTWQIGDRWHTKENRGNLTPSIGPSVGMRATPRPGP